MTICLFLAIFSYTQTAQSYLEYGQEKMRLKDVNGAISDFTKAININPNFEIAIMNRAVARMAQGNWSLAIPDCDKAIDLNSSQAIAFFIRGCAKANTGKNGCSDLNRSFELGYSKASIAIKKFCNQ